MFGSRISNNTPQKAIGSLMERIEPLEGSRQRKMLIGVLCRQEVSIPGL